MYVGCLALCELAPLKNTSARRFGKRRTGTLGAVLGDGTDLVQASLLGEAIDRGPMLVFVADETMRYLAVNRLACETLGYTRDELLRLRVPDVAVASDAPNLYEQMLREGRQQGRTNLRRKDGSVVPFRYWAQETTTAGMTFWVSVGYVDEPGSETRA